MNYYNYQKTFFSCTIVLLKPILSDIHKYLHQIKMVLVYLPPIVKYRWFSKILYNSTINLFLFNKKNEPENLTDFLVGVGHNKDSKGNPTSTRKKVKLIIVITVGGMFG